MASEKKTEKPTTDRLVYELHEPVEYKGEVITDLPYRKATGRDVRKAFNTPKSGDRYLALMVDLFERDEKFFLALPAPDFVAITDIIDVFLKPAPAT